MTHAAKTRSPSARSLRDETLKVETSKVHKNQLLGSGGPQDACNAQPTRDCRASGCRSRGPVHRLCGSWVSWACTVSDAPSRPERRARLQRTSARPTLSEGISARSGRMSCGTDIPPQAGGAPSFVRTFSGWVYVAFITDVYSQRIIGW